MLTAGMLALTAACSGSSLRGGTEPTQGRASAAGAVSELAASPPQLEMTQPETTGEPAATGASSRLLAPAEAPSATVTEPLPAERANTLPTRKSPIQAMNQLLTSQALLVSLLLAPLSKTASEEPLARVDVPPASAGAPGGAH